MKCELELCIYNDEGSCTIGDVSIDRAGCCGDCVLVSLDKDVLAEYKNKLLKKFSGADNK